jgi:hypothetical protein
MPMRTLFQESSTTYANGNSGLRVFNKLCQWELWPKGFQQPMPMRTLAQGSLITMFYAQNKLYTFSNPLLMLLAPYALTSHKHQCFNPPFSQITQLISQHQQAKKLIKYFSNHNSIFIFQLT